jgi:hypothetical protein
MGCTRPFARRNEDDAGAGQGAGKPEENGSNLRSPGDAVNAWPWRRETPGRGGVWVVYSHGIRGMFGG